MPLKQLHTAEDNAMVEYMDLESTVQKRTSLEVHQ